MSNNTLFRYYIETDREIKNKLNEKKQLEKEINERFDEGKLGGN